MPLVQLRRKSRTRSLAGDKRRLFGATMKLPCSVVFSSATGRIRRPRRTESSERDAAAASLMLIVVLVAALSLTVPNWLFD